MKSRTKKLISFTTAGLVILTIEVLISRLLSGWTLLWGWAADQLTLFSIPVRGLPVGPAAGYLLLACEYVLVGTALFALVGRSARTRSSLFTRVTLSWMVVLIATTLASFVLSNSPYFRALFNE